MQRQDMYVAMARNSDSEPFEMVTLRGEIFVANKGLIDLFIEKSAAKHPDWQFEVRKVRYE